MMAKMREKDEKSSFQTLRTQPKLYAPGWGYPAAWWKETCGGEGELYSWGYYEEPMQKTLEEDYWVIAHSFGFYRLPREVLEKAKGVLWYGGFLAPLPFARRTWEASSSSIESVLEKFRTRLFFPSPSRRPPELLFPERLLCDLQQLSCFDYEAFWKTPGDFMKKIVCVFGEKDRVVEPVQSSHETRILVGEGHMPDSKKGTWKQCIEQLMSGTER